MSSFLQILTVFMKPRTPQPESRDIFKQSLAEMINLKHPLVKLGNTINWDVIIEQFGIYFVSDRGRPALSPRLVAGLLYLQHAYDCSDEEIVNTWIESPYVQYFTGETYFQTQAPMDSSSLTRWRKRIGEEGVELLLQVTIEAGTKLGMLRASSFNRIIVDTTVMPKAIAHPTDSRLLERSREYLVKFADKHNLSLRQNYNREAPRLALMAGRYAHAKQYRRMRKANKLLKTRVGRVMRDVQRQLDTLPEHHQLEGRNLLFLVNRILTQQKQDKNKLYAFHAPEVSCIAKGKARTPYEFGCKVTVATTLNEGFIVGMRSMPGNPYDGHTLAETVEQVSILTDRMPHTVIVDRGYKGAAVEGVRILRSGQKRGLTKRLKSMIDRRSAIEPTIGHMKTEGRLARNPLKGELGDALHAVLCGAGHNIRLLMKKLRLLWVKICSTFVEMFFGFDCEFHAI